MSLDLQRRRLVKIIPTTRETEDDYGNQVTTEGDPVEVMAARDQLTSTEDVADRDQQARTFRYFFEIGTVIDGRSILEDAGKRLKIVGEPEVFENVVGPHHIEAVAELVEG